MQGSQIAEILKSELPDFHLDLGSHLALQNMSGPVKSEWLTKVVTKARSYRYEAVGCNKLAPAAVKKSDWLVFRATDRGVVPLYARKTI